MGARTRTSNRGQGRQRQQQPSKREATPLVDILRDVVSIPTASYLEQNVHAYLRRFAEERGLRFDEDRYGNAYITHRKGRAGRPLVLGAHTDHPGFVVTEAKGKRLTLEFRGGLSADYGKGERLRIYGADGAERGTAEVTSVDSQAARQRWAKRISGAKATLNNGGPAEPGDMALWDVDVCRVRGQIVHARQCDDLVGAVAVLAALDRVAASGANGHLVGLFTRAEEVGLLGASSAAKDRLLPENGIVIAVECSSMAGGRAEQGGGPIVRVGDLQHIFSPRVTQWMTAVAQELASEDASFRFQRKLMDGGTTEATAYDLFGYETGAACIALGNYHNAGPEGQVRAETVHLGDLDGLARLFERMLATLPRYERYLPEMRKRYESLAKDAAARLESSRDGQR